VANPSLDEYLMTLYLLGSDEATRLSIKIAGLMFDFPRVLLLFIAFAAFDCWLGLPPFPLAADFLHFHDVLFGLRLRPHPWRAAGPSSDLAATISYFIVQICVFWNIFMLLQEIYATANTKTRELDDHMESVVSFLQQNK
jgi:hypothetical protein